MDNGNGYFFKQFGRKCLSKLREHRKKVIEPSDVQWERMYCDRLMMILHEDKT